MNNNLVSFMPDLSHHASISTSDGLEVVYTNVAGRLAGYEVSHGETGILRRVQIRNPQLSARIVAVTNEAAGAEVSHFHYAHDDLHRPVSRNADAFAYNARGEVASATVASNAASYAYDPIGNRTPSSDGFGNRAYAHNALNEMTTNSLSALVYDADGNLVGDGECPVPTYGNHLRILHLFSISLWFWSAGHPSTHLDR